MCTICSKKSLQYPFSCGYFECLTYWNLGFITTAYTERKGVRSPPAMILINHSIAFGVHIFLFESWYLCFVHSPDTPKSRDHWNQIWLKPITKLFNIRKDEIYYMMNDSQAKWAPHRPRYRTAIMNQLTHVIWKGREKMNDKTFIDWFVFVMI